MKKLLRSLLIVLCVAAASFAGAQNPDSLSSFYLQATACVNQHVPVEYTGYAPPTATYTWDFGGAVIISGSGQGPYWLKWETPGVKVVTLTVHWELQTSTTAHEIHIIPKPEIFEMTGGGIYYPGGDPVPVGLSGSQVNIIYKLRKDAVYTGINIVGTGQPISFGAFTEPGSYSVVAKVDGADCIEEMAGNAVITLGGGPPETPHICMVTFDTLAQKNLIVWNKPETPAISHFNIYKETYVNGSFEKIAEVPYASFSTWIDTGSYPLVKSDRYRLSVTDTLNHESEKSPHHKTIHLNISAGIYGFNLIWNHYEGYEFVTYRIYRKLGTGPFEWLASVASNVDSYTDFYTLPGLATYYIEAVRLEPCNPWLKDNGYISAVSNYATSAPLGIGDKDGAGITVYPNPVTSVLHVDFTEMPEGPVNVKAMSAQGQVVIESIVTAACNSIDLSALSPGIYFLRIEAENFNAVRKVVKQ